VLLTDAVHGPIGRLAMPEQRSGTTLQSHAEMRTVTSSDGTSLVVERVTRGERNVLMVPGGPSTRARWADVARKLDGHLSCWLMDRRGKGESGDTEPYSFAREYDDLSAVAAAIGGPVVLAAHSSGATCALGAALRGTPFASLVLYEPPWPVDGPLADPGQIEAVESLIAAGDRDGALELAFGAMVGCLLRSSRG
jgi:alpha-beta hydrolase superfamily lysophospholipase